MSAIGFHVWNPQGYLPTVVHQTIEAAVTEAERLTRANPGQSFIVMSPVLSAKDALTAKAWSDGVKEGRQQMLADVRSAERRADLDNEQMREQAAVLSKARALLDNASEHQAAIADCILWFDGFSAAHAQRESWERPHVPNRDRLTALNGALQRVMESRTNRPLNDDEIPF